MEDCFIIISNIPPGLHTSDLRRFFSNFVESEKFLCFHFRHRPEKTRKYEIQPSSSSNNSTSDDYSRQLCGRVNKKNGMKSEKGTNCCIVKLKTEFASDFISQYHRKHWLDSKDEELPAVCLVNKIKLLDNNTNVPDSDNDDEKNVHIDDPSFLKLPELQPPPMMPKGNVGTTTKFFLQAINECRLPARLIGKLKLEFPVSNKRKFGAVPHQYEGNGILLERRKIMQQNKSGPTVEDQNASDPEDNDTCEEWERHEALHNDVQANRAHHHQVQSSSYLAEAGDLEQQDGTKERLYEEEIELVWEKGGSGLNFYTDAQHWKSLEGDFDERNTDDWDVDMSVYYEKDTSHDKDATDAYEMRRSDFFRDGSHTESVFHKKRKSQVKRNAGQNIGSFECYTKGYGGKIMSKSGWKAGEGLGKSRHGITTPIIGEEEGQGPMDKSGVGYHGEKIQFCKAPDPSKVKGYSKGGVNITSMYSTKSQMDPKERVDRSNPPLYMKFRDHPVKFCRGGVEGGSNNS